MCPSLKSQHLDATENVRLVDTGQFASVVVLDLYDAPQSVSQSLSRPMDCDCLGVSYLVTGLIRGCLYVTGGLHAGLGEDISNHTGALRRIRIGPYGTMKTSGGAR